MADDRKVKADEEDLQQVASLIKTLKEIDQNSQRRIAHEENEADSMLQSVAQEVELLEQESRERLQLALEEEKKSLSAQFAASLASAQQRYDEVTRDLKERYDEEHLNWTDQLVRRALHSVGKPEIS